LRFVLTIILPAALALGLASSQALAGWSDFVPRPFENGAYFDLFGSKESDDTENAGRNSEWSDTFFTEKLTLYSNGYSYDPRFLQYQFSISGALKQENYTQSFAPSTGWRSDTGLDYVGRLFFLPEHPYNFQLFALRYEPLYKEQSQTRHRSVETSNGARFRYRSKPYFFNAGYLDNTLSSETESSNVKRLDLNGEYFREFGGGYVLSATAFYMPSEFSGDQSLEGSATQYGVTGLVDFHSVRVNLTATQSDYEQESAPSGRLTNDQFAFQERLSAFFPLNFRGDFLYRVLDNESTSRAPGSSAARELSDDSEDFEAILSHRLYQSLDSRYVFLRTERTSSGGNSLAVSHSLGADYAKSIRRGRILVGVNLSTIQTDSAGRTDVSTEPHPAVPVPTPPGAFVLSQQNVDQDTLVVYLRSPLPPFETIRLVESIHYEVTLVGNSLEINVFLLPPPFLPGTYDFVASYSLTTGTFELRTNSAGFHTSVQLLDDLLTPYYRYLAVRSEVLSGVFPGVPLDSTTNTVGLAFQQGPWRAFGEYESLDWEVSPYREWRGEVQYTGSIDPTLRVYGTADYQNRHYPNGSSAGEPTPYTEESATLSGSVQKEFLSRTLMFSAGGSYTRVLGLVDSNAYALDSSMTYRIGRIELSAGVDVYGADTRGFGGGQYDRAHQYYYVKVRRRLF
jgi:hypothetical protein